MQIIFGPVNSRRFGKSLGIDLSPALKQCNYDCLYCELAPAPAVNAQSRTVAVDEVMQALEAALQTHPDVDVITVTANGEPTLYPELPELMTRIDAVKGAVQTLILTNSAALTDATVFETLLRFDQVKLSLDAATQQVFRKLDRPAPGIEIATIITAMSRFSRRYDGQLFLEILFVKGINDTPEEIEALNRALPTIEAHRIDIGTIDRPPAYGVSALSYAELHAIACAFDPGLPIHIVSGHGVTMSRTRYTPDEILSTLARRPLTTADMQLLFDDASMTSLQQLIDAAEVVGYDASGVTFYLTAENAGRMRP